MKPDFALSLSQEGIVLFHRAPDGWDELGTVAVDSTDLLAELATLREKGLAAANLGRAAALPCKIVLPNDLVRYIALDDPRAGETEILAALDGTTPYRLTELAHDHRTGGGRTHIAAVARANLDEAEAFAIEHGFAPVAFVATPEPFTFPGEVNFGPTRIAATILPAGETFEPDDEGVPITPAAFAAEIREPGPATAGVVTDDGTLPEPPVAEAQPPADAGAEDMPPVPAPEPGESEASDPAPATEPAFGDAQAPLPDTDDTREDEADNPATEETPGKESADAASGPPPVFASRSRPQGIAPALPPLVHAPARPPAPEVGERTGEPVFSRRSLRAVPAGEGTRQDSPLATPATPPEPAADGDRITPLAAPARPVTLPKMPGQHAARDVEPAPEPARPHRRIGLGLVLTLMLLAVLAAVALWSTTLEGGLSAFLDRETRPTAATTPTDARPADPVAAAGEAERIATTGLDPAAGPGPEAASLSPELPDGPGPDAETPGAATPDANERAPGLPDLAQPDTDGTGGTDLPFAATEPDVSGLLARGEARPETAPDAADLLAVAAGAAVVGTLVAPEEADRVYEATGVWLRAPRLPLLPRGEALDELALSAADPARDKVAPVALAEGPGLAPDPGLPMQPDPPPAGTTITRDARGIIVATPDGVLLPTGITVFAGAPPVVPPTRPGTPPPPPAIEAAAMVEASGIRPPARPESVLQAAIAAGAVEAEEQPEEAVLEDASDDDDGAAIEAPAGGVALALVAPALRPQARSESAVPPPSWEGTPPPNRPASFASLAAPEAQPPEPAAEDPLAETLSAIVAGPDPLQGVTASAVPQAQRPDARPRNFNRVVQTQTEILARASTAAPAAAPASEPAPAAQPAAGPATSGNLTREEEAEAATEVSTVAAPATGPTPGGAAQAATVSRAINLREINLIGVFGPQSARRALVRLANGRLVRVGVGDSLDGGQVVAIGDGFLNYAKRGQTYSLQVPG